MRRTRKTAAVMLLVVLSVLPLPAAGIPVFSSAEWLQDAMHWIDTMNQYLQTTKKWIADAERISKTLVAMASGDFNDFMDGMQDIMYTVSDWGITSGIVDNFIDAAAGELGAIQDLYNGTLRSFNDVKKAWEYIEAYEQNMDWSSDGNPLQTMDKWLNNITGMAEGVIDGTGAIADSVSRGFGDLSTQIEGVGNILVSGTILSAELANYPEKINKAAEDARKKLEEYHQALQDGNDAKAEEAKLAYETALQNQRDLVEARNALEEQLRALNEDYNKARGRANENLGRSSALVASMLNRAGMSASLDDYVTNVLYGAEMSTTYSTRL